MIVFHGGIFIKHSSLPLAAQPLLRLSGADRSEEEVGVRLKPLGWPNQVSYSRIWLWLHCAAFPYSTTDLPVVIERSDTTIGSSGHKRWPLRCLE